MLSDPFASVRVRAVRALHACVACVSHVPSTDANIFPEYVLPAVHPLCSDRNQRVRAELASNIAGVRVKLTVSRKKNSFQIRIFFLRLVGQGVRSVPRPRVQERRRPRWERW